MLYFDQFTDFRKIFRLQMTDLILKIICRTFFYLSFFSFFKLVKIDLAVKMVKKRNFLHVDDLSFDARFAKCCQFSLNYRKSVQLKINKDINGMNLMIIFFANCF